MNRFCADITLSHKKMLEFPNTENIDASMELELLSRKQRQEKYRELRVNMNAEKLKNLNITRKNRALVKRAALNKRFIELIGSKDILRLSTLFCSVHQKICENIF